MRTSHLGWLAWLGLLAATARVCAAPVLREGDVDVGDGVRIHYVEGGRSDAATTVLFVPGWAATAAVWRDAMAALAGEARVVAIDPRSQGASTISLRGNTPEQRAHDLRAVVRALALPRIVLVGWSQGVQDVAAYAAAFGGDGIAGYVLVDAPVAAGAGASVAQPDSLRETLEQFALYQQHPREYLDGMMNAIIRSAPGRRRIAEYVEAALRTPPDLGVAMLVADFVAYDRRPALAKFDRPTLVIASTLSPELDAQRRMAEAIRGARFETVADAGHALFLDQPERFNTLLAGFLRRHAAAGAKPES